MSSAARHPRDGADQDPRSARPSLMECWGNLSRDQRLAAVAAALLFATMLLPWYQQNAVVSAAKSQPLVSRNLDAFAVFSFVEAAVLLVAIAVLVLLYARAAGRAFELPGGDGAVVFAAGIWTALLLVLRLFDKPGITQHGVAANVGIQWGIFFALAAAGLLAYAGSRMRAARRPDPPLLRRDVPSRPHRARARRYEPDKDTTVALPARARPTGAPPVAAHERSGTAPNPPLERDAGAGLDAARERTASAAAKSARPRYPVAPKRQPHAAPPARTEQLSFDDSPADSE